MNKNMITAALITVSVTAAGCSPSFWGGAAGGTVGTGGAYELHFNNELKRLDEDLAAGKIDQKEYEIRRDQIRRSSILR